MNALRGLRSIAWMLVLGIGMPSAAEAQISLAGSSHADWTVLTVAPDGAWGTATEAYTNRAISNAIARCREMSKRTLGCGARLVTVQQGWALGLRCGEENILATGATLSEATENGRRRELELRRLYHPKLPGCGHLVLVGPDGSVRVPQAQAVATDSRP